MLKLLPKKRKNKVFVLVGALILLGLVGAAGLKWVAIPFAKKWREERANNLAREYMEKGDYASALTAARKTIQYNRNNVQAWKLAVEITEKQDSPQLFVYQQGLASVEPTLENKLKSIRTAIKYRAFSRALDAINKIGPEASESAEFYELASQVSLLMRNPTKAKYYLMSLVKLRPEDTAARLDLARIRLVDGFDDNKPSIRAEIRTLANVPELRVRALTLLLADAVQNKNDTDSLEIANQLSLLTDVPAGTQIMVAEAYRQSDPKRFPIYLEELKKAYADKPDHIAMLIGYLASHSLFAEAKAWVADLPPASRDDENIQIAYASSLLKAEDLAALEAYLRPLKWKENEYARQLMLAYTARQRGDTRSFNEAWRLTGIEAGSDPRRIQNILERVSGWRWAPERAEMLWKKFSLNPADKVTRQQLATWESLRRDTVGLNRLYGRINENEPSDRDSKNNYAYTSLLLGTSLDRAHGDARENYRADPDNPYYATTYALSLYKQNNAEDALQILETLSVSSLAVDQRTLLHSVLLIANGRIDEGLEQSSHLKLDQLLPEERALFEEAERNIARIRRDQARSDRLATLTNSLGSTPGTRKSWVQALPAAYRTQSVQMELADSLYATDDFAGLETLLKSEKWSENDFLRVTLLTYAQKNLGKETEARSSWRTVSTMVGNHKPDLSVLEEICERWNWSTERLEILNRIVERDPLDSTAMADLIAHYQEQGLTRELARLYTLRVGAENPSPDDKSNFAYYSLLTNTNTSRAHVLARQAFDAAPENPLHAKAFAFSLLRQSRPADAARTMEALPANPETGPGQLALLRAAIAVEQNRFPEARQFLDQFDAPSALPEEQQLAESLANTITDKTS